VSPNHIIYWPIFHDQKKTVN